MYTRKSDYSLFALLTWWFKAQSALAPLADLDPTPTPIPPPLSSPIFPIHISLLPSPSWLSYGFLSLYSFRLVKDNKWTLSRDPSLPPHPSHLSSQRDLIKEPRPHPFPVYFVATCSLFFAFILFCLLNAILKFSWRWSRITASVYFGEPVLKISSWSELTVSFPCHWRSAHLREYWKADFEQKIITPIFQNDCVY